MTSIFNNKESFEAAKEMATFLATSSMVPVQFKGSDNLANVMLAIELANSLQVSPIMVMSNLQTVEGKLGFSSRFIISLLKQRHNNLEFIYSKDRKECMCIAGELQGEAITIDRAKAEGWYDTNKSWQTMPEVMLMYRAACLFQKLHEPDLTVGLVSAEELTDVSDRVKQPIQSAEELREARNSSQIISVEIPVKNEAKKEVSKELAKDPGKKVQELKDNADDCPF